MPKSLIVGLKSLTPIRNTAVRPSGFGRWASKRSRSDPSMTDYLLEITLRCSQRGENSPIWNATCSTKFIHSDKTVCEGD